MSKLLRLPLKSTEDELYELCPITATMLIASGYEHDLYDQFSYPIENDQIRFYNLSKKEIEDILDQAPKMYGLIVDSLEILFERHMDKVSKYFGEIFNEAKYKNFLDYAAWTYENDHVALYGRFDIPYDYENGKIKGFYEFNGDTPVMIHESVYVQDLFSRKIGQPDSQVNLHYEYMKGFISNHLKKEKVKGVGVFADMAYIEDSLTAEYFFELFHSEFGQDKTVIGQISDLGFDDCSLSNPFNAYGKELSHIFILQPWEDMVDGSPETFRTWRKWKDSVKFYEPAWRYFISNKGIWAWVWDVMNSEEFSNETEFRKKYSDVSGLLLETRLTTDSHSMKDFCRKPLNGRLSNNIEIYKSSNLVTKTEGFYANTETVDQRLCMSGSIAPNEPMAILGVWMAPDPSIDDKLTMEGVNISFREFDDDINSIVNEKYIPHLFGDIEIEEIVGEENLKALSA